MECSHPHLDLKRVGNVIFYACVCGEKFLIQKASPKMHPREQDPVGSKPEKTDG